MDILKVLSRGIKPSAKKATPQTTALPSAGARPNPQLFHDPIAGAAPRGKKRKRKSKQTDSNDDPNELEPAHDTNDDEELSDVDFFAESKPKPSPEKPGKASVAADGTPSDKTAQKPTLLDEETVGAMLRSHRLKFTVLAGGLGSELREDEAEPARKRKKKRGGGDGDKNEEADREKKRKKKLKDQLVFPQPLRAFGELKYVYGVDGTVCDNIARQGFRVPTEVQMGSLPLLLRPGTALPGVGVGSGGAAEGRVDFLGVAPTGSGKTVSFLVPAIDAVLRSRKEVGEHVLRAVVVAPTRELASQIVNEGRKLALGTGVRVALMKRALRLVAEEVGGRGGGGGEESGEEDGSEGNETDEGEESQEEGEQGDKDAKPHARVDILVTTPKTLLNFLSGGKATAKKALPSVTSLILDEADVLLDPVFQKQTLAIWRACTSPELNLTCWSATMASHIEALVAKEITKRTRRPTTSRPLIRLIVGLKDTAVPNVTHKLIYTATEQGKLLAIRQLLHPVSSADSGPPLRPPFLVFTQTIERAQALHDELQYDIPLEAGGSARVAVLHSSLSGSARSKIMTRFRTGDIWVLITTDVLARGVDFAGVNGVVNYDVPGSAAAYVHRAGRTGRAGREGGVAVTFYTKDDIPFVKSVANVIAASEKQAARAGAESVVGGTVQKWLLDALPKVAKDDKRKLKVRGVESRRTGGNASISTKSAWERRRENNRRAAIEASKRRRREGKGRAGASGRESGASGRESDDEWGGLDD